MKAISFSDKIKTEIQNAKQAILNRMYSEMEFMKTTERAKENEALEECRRYYEDTRRKVTERIERRNAEYDTWRS